VSSLSFRRLMSDVSAPCLREAVMETTQGRRPHCHPIRKVLAQSVDYSQLRQQVSIITNIAR
jgi:hypothetical protein